MLDVQKFIKELNRKYNSKYIFEYGPAEQVTAIFPIINNTTAPEEPTGTFIEHKLFIILMDGSKKELETVFSYPENYKKYSLTFFEGNHELYEQSVFEFFEKSIAIDLANEIISEFDIGNEIVSIWKSVEESKTEQDFYDKLFLKVKNEIIRALELHGDFTTNHEALGVIYEEFDELKKEIFAKKHNNQNIREECIQIMAMCAKFIHFLNKKEEKEIECDCDEPNCKCQEE